MLDSKLLIDDKAPDETLGSYLTRARNAAGLSREDLAQTTRIQLNTLAGIEDSDWKKFPVEAYVRSYINTICTKLGLDRKKVLGWFSVEYGSSYSEDFVPKIEDISAPSSAKKIRESAAAGNSKTIPILLVVLGIAFLAIMNFMKKNEGSEQMAVPAVESSSAAEDSTAMDSAIAAGMMLDSAAQDSLKKADSLAVSSSSVKSSSSAKSSSSVKSSSSKAKSSSSMQAVKSSVSSAATTFLPVPAPKAEANAPKAAAGESAVSITAGAKGVSWVGIKKHAEDADFQKEGNLSEKNPTLSYNSADTMYVIIGNPAGVVKMTVNGAAVQVPVNPNGRTARLCILNGKVIKEWR